MKDTKNNEAVQKGLGPAALKALIFMGLLLPCVCLVGMAGLVVAAKSKWRTGARKVAWTGPEGRALEGDREELYPWSGCKANDIGFTSLQFDGGVWVPCSHPEAFPQGAYARIDPGERRGRVLWVLPTESKRAWTKALLPGPDRQLAVVYKTDERADELGNLVMGIMGPEGWARAPERLPGTHSTRYLGGAWVDGALEIVLALGSKADPHGQGSPPLILRVEGGSITTREPFEGLKGMCKGFDPDTFCHATLAFRRGGQWLYFLNASSGGKRDGGWELNEGGQHSPSPWGVDNFLALDVLGHSVTGSLRKPLFRFAGEGEYRLGLLGTDGQITAFPDNPAPEWKPSSTWQHFETRDGHLSAIDLWTVDDPRFGTGRKLGDRHIMLLSTEGTLNYELQVVDQTDPDNLRVTEPARAPSYACGDLYVGTLLPDTRGGHWLVGTDGCYIQLTDELERADPLNISEHLRRRGSLGMDWDEHSHIAKLIWVLGGLPFILLLIACVVTWRTRERREERPLEMLTALCWGTAFFVFSGSMCLYQLLPLLN